LRPYPSPQIVQRPSQQRLVGGLVHQEHYPAQRHLIDQRTKFEDGALSSGCESAQVHDHQITLRHQPSHGLLPGIDAAEEFVDAIAAIRIGPIVEIFKASVEIDTRADVAAG
jgi:hypothetical protein